LIIETPGVSMMTLDETPPPGRLTVRRLALPADFS
jgi:hypothetical protein